MIKFKGYYPVEGRYDPARHYGWSLELHPKRKALYIYLGKKVWVFWIGREY